MTIYLELFAHKIGKDLKNSMEVEKLSFLLLKNLVNFSVFTGQGKINILCIQIIMVFL